MIPNLLATVTGNLGYKSLHKIDPNEQEVKAHERFSTNEKLHQAAVPATLLIVW
ncbi:MAG TPA: hypothetical protein PLR74_13935 [Agriterribacter sp.]|nr:hypothetical protein [Agriterribacter sp.]